MAVTKPDFSGWATKNDLECSDGRTIRANAFKVNDGFTVPLLWQHGHNDPENVLGHALLQNRPEGVYAYAWFNETERGQVAKQLVAHGDINMLSIFANKLIQKGKDVLHGAIRELSLVISGANPGAYIDNILLQHGDDFTPVESEAVIYTGLFIEHADFSGEVNVWQQPDFSDDPEGASMAHAEGDKSIQDILDTFNPEQKDVLLYMIEETLKGAPAVQHSDDDSDDEDLDEDDADETDDTDDSTDGDNIQHANQEGNPVRNVFMNHNQDTAQQSQGVTLSHAQMLTIVEDFKKSGSFKGAFLAHAGEFGITNMEDVLFPDARVTSNEPELITRRMAWVSKVIDGCVHSPFSRVKCVVADITAEQARARGYVKGKFKKEMLLKVLKRVTGPKTFYIKAKLDRDDITDITDMDVVAWMKKQMRLLFLEETARAILLSDGRAIDDEDKIDEEHIRPIIKENSLFAHQVVYDKVASAAAGDTFVDAMLRARNDYKGSGAPTFFTTNEQHVAMLLLKDDNKRRLYNSDAELCAALNVSEIVEVEPMEQIPHLLGVIVNLTDYTIGADKGGEVNFFDDFDIDYNQLKYLYESRLSGALTKPKSALVIWEVGHVPTVESVEDMLPTPVVPPVGG
jgi:hypothetical protein